MVDTNNLIQASDSTNDFDMYEGEDAEPYYPIRNSLREDKDLSQAEEVVFVAVNEVEEPIITLHLTDPDSQISIDYDPDEESATVLNTIFVHLKPIDTDGFVGVHRHEIAVTLVGKRTVVFPAVVGSVHTFTVAKSYTWDEETHAERLSGFSGASPTKSVVKEAPSSPRRIRIAERPKRFLNVTTAESATEGDK